MARNNFIDYYDDMVEKWLNAYKAYMDNGSDEKEFDDLEEWKMFSENIPTLEIKGMPEPYFGDPEKCSAVIININPGQTIDTNDVEVLHPGNIMKHYGIQAGGKTKYSEIAKAFPYLNPEYCNDKDYKALVLSMKKNGLKQDSAGWWQSRNKWINNILSYSHIKSDLKPFAIEMCPWHSYEWDNNKNNKCFWENKELRDHIKKYVIEPACKAVKNSQLKFGLIIGKAVCDVIIRCDPENNWERKRMPWNREKWDDINGKWPTKEIKDGDVSKNRITRLTRHYDILTNGEISFLCTWTTRNIAPSKEFADVEKYITHKI